MSREEAWRQVSGPAIADARDRNENGGAFYQFCRQTGEWPTSVSGWDFRTEEARFVPYMPVQNVTPEFPPTVLIHGDQDTDVPYEQSELMSAKFKKHNVDHQLIRVRGGEHGLAGAEPKAIEQAYADTVAFLKRRLDRK